MKKSKPKVWLARDGDAPYWDNYILDFEDPPRQEGDVWLGSAEITAAYFERIAPKSCHLKPGEGPIEITVDIKKVK